MIVVSLILVFDPYGLGHILCQDDYLVTEVVETEKASDFTASLWVITLFNWKLVKLKRSQK